ncbi:MAG TPA: hypothetical protein VGD66_13660 [Allosphingosinicella sp.]
MGGSSLEERRRQERRLIAACRREMLRRPLAEVTMTCLAEACGFSVWTANRALYRVMANREQLFRRAVVDLVRDIEAAIGRAPAPAPSVFQSVRAYVEHMARVMQLPDYRSLLFLLVRDGPYHPWVRELYETRVAHPLVAGLERAALAAGADAVAVFFRKGAPAGLLRKMEQALVVPWLLAGDDLPTEEAVRRLVEQGTGEAIASSYAYEVGAAA